MYHIYKYISYIYTILRIMFSVHIYIYSMVTSMSVIGSCKSPTWWVATKRRGFCIKFGAHRMNWNYEPVDSSGVLEGVIVTRGYLDTRLRLRCN